MAPVIDALLHGKLRLSEDVLTSSVIGTLASIDFGRPLLQFLAASRCLDGSHPIDAAGADIVAMNLWPSHRRYGEPDAVVHARAGDVDLLIMIEAKYGAQKTSWDLPEDDPRVDQLARYWDGWRTFAKSCFGVVPVATTRCVVVYLTSHPTIPIAEIEESLARLHAAPEACIAWLPWGDASRVLEPHRDTPSSSNLAAKLCDLLDRNGFVSFDGFLTAELRTPVVAGWSHAAHVTTAVTDIATRWFEQEGA